MPYTTSTATTGQHLTADDMLREMQRVMLSISPCPIGQWMRLQGFPPETSMLVLPESMRAEVGPFTPRYVRFAAVATPLLCKDPLAELRLANKWPIF